jgi:hypothetical protein
VSVRALVHGWSRPGPDSVAVHWAPAESVTDSFPFVAGGVLASAVFGVVVGGVLGSAVFVVASAGALGSAVSVVASAGSLGSAVCVGASVDTPAVGDVEVSPPVVDGADPPLEPVDFCVVVGVLAPAVAGVVVTTGASAMGDVVGVFGSGSPFTTIVSVVGCPPGVVDGL